MSVKVDKLIGTNGTISVDDLIELLNDLNGSSKVGENILKAPLAVDVRTILELVKQTSLVDATAGRMLQVGSFGLGSSSVNTPYVSNLDSTSTSSGFYYVDLSTTGTFPNGTAIAGMLQIDRYPINGNIAQTFKYLGNGSSTLNSEFFRVYNTSKNSWNPWSRNYNSSSILGTVSQLSGVPTGAVIESGSNSNGAYIRFANGTQICSGNNTSNGQFTVTSSVNNGQLYYSVSANLTFPASFSEVPSVVPGVVNQAGYFIWPASDSTPTTTTTQVYLVSPSNTAKGNMSYIAFGRWY